MSNTPNTKSKSVKRKRNSNNNLSRRTRRRILNNGPRRVLSFTLNANRSGNSNRKEIIRRINLMMNGNRGEGTKKKRNYNRKKKSSKRKRRKKRIKKRKKRKN